MTKLIPQGADRGVVKCHPLDEDMIILKDFQHVYLTLLQHSLLDHYSCIPFDLDLAQFAAQNLALTEMISTGLQHFPSD